MSLSLAIQTLDVQMAVVVVARRTHRAEPFAWLSIGSPVFGRVYEFPIHQLSGVSLVFFLLTERMGNYWRPHSAQCAANAVPSRCGVARPPPIC